MKKMLSIVILLLLIATPIQAKYVIAYNNVGNLNDMGNMLSISRTLGSCEMVGGLTFDANDNQYQLMDCSNTSFDYDDAYAKYFEYKNGYMLEKNNYYEDVKIDIVKEFKEIYK